MTVEIARIRNLFGNGTIAETVTTADDATGTNAHSVVTVTLAKDADGATVYPPGYPDAFPGAAVQGP